MTTQRSFAGVLAGLLVKFWWCRKAWSPSVEGAEAPHAAKTTSSLQPLKKPIVYVKVFINCGQCYGCLELPICFSTHFSHTYIHTHKQPSTPPFPTGLHPRDGQWTRGGNEVTHTHTHIRAKTHRRGFCPALLRPSRLSIPGIFVIAFQPPPPHSHTPTGKPQPTF